LCTVHCSRDGGRRAGSSHRKSCSPIPGAVSGASGSPPGARPPRWRAMPRSHTGTSCPLSRSSSASSEAIRVPLGGGGGQGFSDRIPPPPGVHTPTLWAARHNLGGPKGNPSDETTPTLLISPPFRTRGERAVRWGQPPPHPPPRWSGKEGAAAPFGDEGDGDAGAAGAARAPDAVDVVVDGGGAGRDDQCARRQWSPMIRPSCGACGAIR